MTTDFRALCVELLQSVEESDDYILAVETTVDLAIRARAALAAEPVPDGPTDEELEKLADDYMAMDGATGVMCLGHLDFARAILDRWRRLAPLAEPEPPAGGSHDH